MKFSIDARGINLYKGSGIGTYTENLLRELLNIDTKNNYSIFWTGENYEDYKKDNSKINFTGNYWKCQCDCGNITSVRTEHLSQGHIKSCGCLKSVGESNIANILI